MTIELLMVIFFPIMQHEGWHSWVNFTWIQHGSK